MDNEAKKEDTIMIGNSTVRRKSAKLMTWTQSVVQTVEVGASSAIAANGITMTQFITPLRRNDWGLFSYWAEF